MPKPDTRRGRLPAAALALTMVLASPLLGAGARQNQTPSTTTSPADPLTLWYDAPASDQPLAPVPAGNRQAAAARTAQWVRALPIGNGRLGAMVFGGVTHERLQLNEDTIWAGRPYDPVNPEARAALPRVRELIAQGQYAEAAELTDKSVLALPRAQMPYQTLGNLALTFADAGPVTGYRRDLNLREAAAHVSYTAGGVHFDREMFASAPDQVIVVRLTADTPGRIDVQIGLETPLPDARIEVDGDTIVLRARNGDGRGTTADGAAMNGALDVRARVRVLPEGGALTADGSTIALRGANAATLLVAAATSYVNYADVSGDPGRLTREAITAASGKGFAALRAAHVADYQRLFNRVTLDLGSTDAANRPTDERIRTFPEGGDPSLAALYFQYGRYLLISSSRPGSQPANLQGVWNESMSPPWGSKYTININTEMNYWPASTTNLDECLDPLVALVLDLTKTGARTAASMYGAGGWVAHHNTDIWRATAPIDGPNYGMWPTGGAWLALHLWDRYRFTGDRAYLERVYPALRGAAAFFLDTLVEEPTHHWLVTSPSLSPENPHPHGSALAAGPTMDNEILRDLFTAVERASEILGTDADLRARWAATRDRLPPLQIGSAGQLQEWLEDWDMQAPEIHHRHVSHLYGLFPGHDIDRYRTPDLAAAVKRSLEIRGDQATGWATAWRINLWAHLGDGDHAYEILRFLLGPERTYPDMLDAHPPFQIDGNFGGTSGMVEMLLQSAIVPDAGDGAAAQGEIAEIRLLPALPSAWPSGRVTGLLARGGFEVDLTWADGHLQSARVTSRLGQPVRVRRGGVVTRLDTRAGDVYTFTGDDLQRAATN